MYNHTRQLRCDFIRGKSQKEMDDMLPLYANTISAVCPCAKDRFPEMFDGELAKQLPSAKEKTLANHRTEIAGSLLGLYYEDGGIIYESERNKKYLQDSDQPALFKDICYKHQFPTGVQKISTVCEKMLEGIRFRPYPFIFNLLLKAEEYNLVINVKDIGYYVLNSEDVLTGKASVDEVFKVIKRDKNTGTVRTIPSNKKPGSYVFQHIREQMNYLELANLIYMENGEIYINHREDDAITEFVEEYGNDLIFDFGDFDLSNSDGRTEAYLAWRKYYGKLSRPAIQGKFETQASAIYSHPNYEQGIRRPVRVDEAKTVELGDEGEDIVLQFEKARVKAFNERLVNRVLPLGKTKGLGYDIQSVVAIPGPEAEYVKYIEVKSTKRVTVPEIDDDSWCESFNMTRNEYLAAQQFKDHYAIFRVYFTRNGVSFYVIENLPQKEADGTIVSVPLTYRIDFSGCSIDSIIPTEEIQETINA